MASAIDRFCTIVNNTSVNLTYYNWVKVVWPWDDNWQYAMGTRFWESQIMRPGESLTIPVGLAQRAGTETATGRHFSWLKVVRQSDVGAFYDVIGDPDTALIWLWEDYPSIVMYITEVNGKLTVNGKVSQNQPEYHQQPPYIGYENPDPFKGYEPIVDDSYRDIIEYESETDSKHPSNTIGDSIEKYLAIWLKENFGLDLDPKKIRTFGFVLIGLLLLLIVLVFVSLIRR